MARDLPPGGGAAPAGRLDLLARARRETVRMHHKGLRQLALAEHLDRHSPARGEAAGDERVRGDLGIRLEARLEVAQVDRLRARAEVLERHRLLHVRAAQLSHAHVDRHLAALEGLLSLVARARAGALLASARRLAVPGALATPQALAPVPRPGGGLERVEPDL